MPLLKDGRIGDDPWVESDGAADLSTPLPLLVDLDKWREHRDKLTRRDAPLGLRLASDQSPDMVADELDRFALIALEFPKFTDGRAYSYARILRERCRFEGEVRAVGNVLRDQLSMMRRCGFDAFEVPETAAKRQWEKAFTDITIFYQPSTDGRAPTSELRRRKAEAAPGHAATTEATPDRHATRPVQGRLPATGSEAESSCCAAHWAY